jgi:branched-chain amino acid transport system permease protein
MLLLMAVASLVLAVAVGALLERLVFRRLYGSDEVTTALASFGLLLAMEDLIPMVFGNNPILLAQPLAAMGTATIGGVVRDVYSLFLIASAAVMGAGLWYVLHHTRAGAIVSAVVDDKEMATAVGIRVSKVMAWVFVFGAILGSLGGALVAPLIAVAPGVGVQIIVMSFAVIVVGGLGSFPGALVGSLVIGLCRAISVHHAPFAELFVVYLVMTASLVVKPQGLFAPRAARRI